MKNYTKYSRQELKDISNGALSHLKSLKVAIMKFKSGSAAEKGYAFEHFEKLKYYLDKL